MGFAASQARLILLTARKSDLEFRAQQITNAEMMLAMRSEEIANKYSRRISNQTAKIIDGNEEVALTYSSMIAKGYTVKDRTTGGTWSEFTSGSETPKQYYLFNIDMLTFDEDGNYVYEIPGEDGKSATEGKVSKGAIEKNIIALGLTKVYDTSKAYINIAGVKVDISAAYEGPFDEPVKGNDLGVSLLEGMQAGYLYVEDAAGNEINVLDNTTGFVVGYNTADDEAADAEYRRETAAIQVKEKRLQMEMKQIEAQQKACENEIESAKKLQDKNADSMFKYMS